MVMYSCLSLLLGNFMMASCQQKEKGGTRGQEAFRLATPIPNLHRGGDDEVF